MRKAFLLAILTATLAVAACNTIAGAGKDVESVGDTVKDTANDAKN